MQRLLHFEKNITRPTNREELRLSRKCKEVICSATNCNSRSFKPHSHLKVKALHMNILKQLKVNLIFNESKHNHYRITHSMGYSINIQMMLLERMWGKCISASATL